jgi:MFS family permease
MSRFVLGYTSFRWLWTSSLCTYAAMWIQQASVAWLVYDHTGSAALVGAVAGVRMIPLLCLAPLSGVAADRYDRRKLLQASQWLAAGAVLFFGAVLALDALQTWMLFAFSLLSSAANVLDRPARQSTAYELVPRERVPQAVGLTIMSNSTMRVAGPAVAGYLIAWFGIAGNFFIQGAFYLASGMLVMLVAFPPRKAQVRQGSAMREMTAGLRYLAREPTPRAMAMIAAVQYFVLVPTFSTLFPVYAKDIFKAGPEGLGMMFTAIGAGGVMGGFIAHSLMKLDRVGIIQVSSLLVFSVAVIAIAMSPTLTLALAACLVAGAAEMVTSTNNQTMMQLTAPSEMRGRVVALNQLNPALIAAGSLVIGPLGDWLGAPAAATAAAVTCAVLALLLLFKSRQLRELKLSDYTGVQKQHA